MMTETGVEIHDQEALAKARALMDKIASYYSQQTGQFKKSYCIFGDRELAQGSIQYGRPDFPLFRDN